MPNLSDELESMSATVTHLKEQMVDSPLDLTDLAQAAAQIVVKGVAGGAAQALRKQLVRLFTRGEPERAEQSPEVRRLEETAQRLGKAPDRAAEERELFTSWKRRLEVFLEDHPDAAEELAQMASEQALGHHRSPSRG